MHKPCISIVSKRADVPSWGRALTLAGMYIYASNHWGVPCTLVQARLNQRDSAEVRVGEKPRMYLLVTEHDVVCSQGGETSLLGLRSS